MLLRNRVYLCKKNNMYIRKDNMVITMAELKNNEINFEFYGDTYRLGIYKTTYTNNDNLAIVVMDEDSQEQFTILTVNIMDLPENNMAAIDTNNNADLAVAVEKAGFYTNTGLPIRVGDIFLILKNMKHKL